MSDTTTQLLSSTDPLLAGDWSDVPAGDRDRGLELFLLLGRHWAMTRLGEFVQQGGRCPELPPEEIVEAAFGDSSPESRARWQQRLDDGDAHRDPRLQAFRAGWREVYTDLGERLMEGREVLAEARACAPSDLEVAGLGPVGQLVYRAPDGLFLVARRDEAWASARDAVREQCFLYQGRTVRPGDESLPRSVRIGIGLRVARGEVRVDDSGNAMLPLDFGEATSFQDLVLESAPDWTLYLTPGLSENVATREVDDYLVVRLLEVADDARLLPDVAIWR